MAPAYSSQLSLLPAFGEESVPAHLPAESSMALSNGAHLTRLRQDQLRLGQDLSHGQQPAAREPLPAALLPLCPCLEPWAHGRFQVRWLCDNTMGLQFEIPEVWVGFFVQAASPTSTDRFDSSCLSPMA